MRLTIDMTEQDFQYLQVNSMRWRANDWRKQAHRFEHMELVYDREPQWNWEMAYWVGDSYAHVILARSFLHANGSACEVVYDLVDDGGSYVILTDYVTATWRTA